MCLEVRTAHIEDTSLLSSLHSKHAPTGQRVKATGHGQKSVKIITFKLLTQTGAWPKNIEIMLKYSKNSDNKVNAPQRFPGWGSAQVAVLLQFAQSLELAMDTVLEGSGITEASLEHRDPSLAQELVVIENLIAHCDTHPFELGVRVGRQCNVNSLGLMGQLLMSSRTPKEMVSLVSEFFSGEHHFLKIRPQINLNEVRTTFEVPDWLSEQAGQFILGRDMGGSIAFQENIIEDVPATVTAVGFVGPELPGMAEIGEYYCCDVHTMQTENYLHSNIKLINMVLPLGNRFLQKVLLKRVQNFFERHSPQVDREVSMGKRIASVLDDVGYMDMSKEQMASRLNVSSRTLSRYLNREGTHWRGLFTQLRMERARHLLVNSRDSVESVAFKTGFSSASAFSNAFSREVGMSPLEFRLSETESELA